tara:strand:+ start:368 stop:622 length:255 start_codon:yes stop_codon:yes gene_type:complete
MSFQNDYQYNFSTMNQNSLVFEYILLPIIVLLLIFLIYTYIKKKIMKDDKEDLESLKILQELLDAGTIDEKDFQKKKEHIISKW